MTQFSEPVTTSNEDTYESLISLIENSQEQLALIIVACDDLALRQRTIERYEREAKQSQIRCERIVLGMEPSLRAGLAKLGIENQDGVVVTVTGAEWLLRVKTRATDAQSDLDKFFGYLQWTREGLREFRYPVVLWVTFSILREMSRRAPDFWSWRKAVLRFESEASEESLAKPALGAIVPVMRDLNSLERSFDREDNNDFIPPPAEILSEIHQLESNNPTSPNLATLYAKLAEIYAKRIARGEANNLEEEQQQAIEAFEKAIDRYRELNKQSALASTLNNFGNFLFNISRYIDATDFYRQSLDINRKIGNLNGESISLTGLGNAFDSLGQYEQAIDFYQQSLDINRKIGDLYGEASSLGNLGIVAWRSLGEYQQAIDFYQQSLEINRKINNRIGEANSLNGLGNIYFILEQYERAIDFYKQSLNINYENSNIRDKAISLNGLGNSYYLLEKYQQAKNFYQQSLETKREIGDLNGEANSLNNLGNIYVLLEHYELAINFYQQSLEIARKIGNQNSEANFLFNQAIALDKYKPLSFEALEKLKQARAIYAKLKLDDKVAECDTEIDNLNRIIATEEGQPKEDRNAVETPTIEIVANDTKSAYAD
ncbi:tetratricopeptide repeat protein [Chamaesiphon polymorphus]|uniref:Tetratricopeptide repeat-containing protein n=1 Tax=Chamaesiphon polymorphus CCALA 037 TaxID=2107692 RepID=A0A2T1GC07_9CYAN|nr:tetratricopeptide repeat protein [Chamaesiphon polymorphus]PSB54906.1 tetratricopeptide repeat-containing protein [Chamaesiphon polymorphus CCALA 037]